MSAPGPAFVRLEAVSKGYGSGSGAVHLLEHVDLELTTGQTTSLLGRSGSGKSTLLSLVAGLLLPDSGGITIGGRRVDRLDEPGRARMRAQQLGIVLQSDNLIPFLTAQENVELAMSLVTRRRSSRARELLSELGLGKRLGSLPRQLSGGEAQRVAVAVALANGPDLLLADEVVGQLDSATAAEVMSYLFAVSRDRGLTLLYVTHDEQLAHAAQHALRLHDRRVSTL